MATTPPLSPSIAVAKSSRVQDWVQRLSDPYPPPSDSSQPTALSPPSSPSDAQSPSLKRKRTTASTPCECAMSARTSSPKRRRADTETNVLPTEVLPSHSVSAAGAATSNAASNLTLNERNTFSPPGSQAGAKSPRRANSPSRDNISVLASASPPTITEPSAGLVESPPERVRRVMGRLEDGLDRGWIPACLQETIEQDMDIGYQRIERLAWDENAAVEDEERARHIRVLRKVKKIWQKARVCQLRGRDENAWCMDVVQPLLKLAIKLEGADKLCLQSVQSQAIVPEFLSSTADASGKLRLLDRKADFALSFSHLPSPGFQDLYNSLRAADNAVISHMADAFTRTTALFSGVEVKPASGDQTEAEYQLSIWMAASLRKKMQLARRAGVVDKSGLVEPCFAVVGHDTHVYFAYMESEERDTVRILGPESAPFGQCETRTLSGVFRALRLWRNVVKYGRDEGGIGFWGGFIREVLQRLAGDIDTGGGQEHGHGHGSTVEDIAQR